MPRLPESEILLAYNQIAEQQQLVKTADTNPEIEKYQNEVHPRVSADSLEDIAKLYDLKNDLNPDKSIIEVAHPNPLFIAPAYDKINGLVENEIERGNINRNIARKPTDGLLTNYKYAQQSLSLSLIKIANYLDASNQQELRTLADQCLNNLHSGKKKLLKTANPLLWAGLNLLLTVAPLVLGMKGGKSTAGKMGVATIITTLVGMAGLVNHINEQIDQGLKAELERAIEKTTDILSSSQVKNNSALMQVFTGLANTLNHLHQEMLHFSELDLLTQDFANQSFIQQLSQDASLRKKLIQEIDFTQQFATDLKQLSNKYLFYKTQIERAEASHASEGTLQQLWHWTKEFFSSNDFEQLKTYLNNINTSMQPILENLSHLKTAIDQLPTQLQEVKDHFSKIDVKSIPTTKELTAPTSEFATIPVSTQSTTPASPGSDDWIFE